MYVSGPKKMWMSGTCAAACSTLRTTLELVQVSVGTSAWALALVTRLVLM